jgi:hypothetical protein
MKNRVINFIYTIILFSSIALLSACGGGGGSDDPGTGTGTGGGTGGSTGSGDFNWPALDYENPISGNPNITYHDPKSFSSPSAGNGKITVLNYNDLFSGTLSNSTVNWRAGGQIHIDNAPAIKLVSSFTGQPNQLKFDRAASKQEFLHVQIDVTGNRQVDIQFTVSQITAVKHFDEMDLYLAFPAGETNAAPVVRMTAPQNNNDIYELGDNITFTGSAIDAEDGGISANIDWSSSKDGHLGTGASINVSSLSLGKHLINATITDRGGITRTTEQTATIQVGVVKKPPSLNINRPAEGASFKKGVFVGLNSTSLDRFFNIITDFVVWTSDRDGHLGTGNLVPTNLSVGTHVITATITTNEGLTNTATRTITITP